jgi:hypothetical protein
MVLSPLNRSSLVLLLHVAGWALGVLVLLYPLLHGVDGQRQPSPQSPLVQHPSVHPSVRSSVDQDSQAFIPPRRGLPDRREGGGSF